MALTTIALALNAPHMFDRDTTLERVFTTLVGSTVFALQYDHDRTPTANSPYIINLTAGTPDQVFTFELGIKYPKGTVVMVTSGSAIAVIS